MAQDLNQISPIEINVKDLWHIVLKKLNNEFGNEIFNSWIKNIKVKSIDDDILYFSVPTRFIRDWITSHYLDKIIFFLNAENPNIRRVKISIDNMLSANHENLEESSSETIKYQNRSSNLSQSDDWPLDEEFTFDKFITGPSNELAFASAKRIAQSEKFDFNPLFLYGGVGLGKTHLMHAIAWEISSKNPNAKVLYLSAERFMFQFIKSLRQKDTMSFKQKFRSVDVLILDDIQFMVGKNSTQEEFFHTFNSLLDLNKKVILSSDRAPSDLEGFDERIKSRLSWGLVADILPASFELRYEILQKEIS